VACNELETIDLVKLATRVITKMSHSTSTIVSTNSARDHIWIIDLLVIINGTLSGDHASVIEDKCLDALELGFVVVPGPREYCPNALPLDITNHGLSVLIVVQIVVEDQLVSYCFFSGGPHMDTRVRESTVARARPRL
jgi:hypothetical protein